MWRYEKLQAEKEPGKARAENPADPEKSPARRFSGWPFLSLSPVSFG
jgi:hypothetical protein